MAKKTSKAKRKVAKKKVAGKKTAKKKVTKKTSARKKAAKKVTKKANKKKTKKKPAKKKVAKKAAKKKVAKKRAKKPAKKAAKKAAKKSPGKKKPAKKKKKTSKKAKGKTSSTSRKAGTKVTRKVATKTARTSTAKAIKKPATAKPTPARKRPAMRRPAKPRPSGANVLSGPLHGFEPYQPRKGEEYMSDDQLEHFRDILSAWKRELMEEVDRTVLHMKDEAANFPDPNDRATQESEFGLELRTRDRERKLLKKIDSALIRIDEGSYGYCDETGEEIGLKRLEARPVATLCVEAQERRELAERQFRDREDRYR